MNQDSSASKSDARNYTSVKKLEVEVDYDNLPYTDDLMVRFCRAENKELICISINNLEKTAVFRSRTCSNDYHTTLNSCTCPDHAIPCKHMFYLANHLGRLEEWKRNLPHEKYDKLVQSYNNCQYRNDPKGWMRDKTVEDNWHPGCTRIGGCW